MENAIALLQAVIAILLGFNLKMTSETRKELAKLNGKVESLKQWTIGHEELDEERFRNVHKRLDQRSVS